MSSNDSLVRVDYPWSGKIHTTYFDDDGFDLGRFYIIAWFRRRWRHRRRRR